MVSQAFVARDVSGVLKRDMLGSSVLEDMEEELVLELSFCSSSFDFFLLVSQALESTSHGARVSPFSELSELPCG